MAPSPAALATNTPAPEGQRRTISDSNLGVSFDLPSHWEPLDRAPDALPGISLRSPPVGQGPEPIIFAIDVESQPTAETSAKSVVDAQLAQVPADLASGIRRQTILVGGQPAEQVVGLPSRSGAIETFILHGGKVYVALLQPYDPENNSLSPYLGSARSAYDGMLSSWKFLQ